MQPTLIALGFLAGMSHALEPDHLAAVGALSAGKTTRAALVSRGAAWGLGHTITLFAICSAVILFGMALTSQMAAVLESGVGIMLIALGGAVLWRMQRARVHFHLHEHFDGERHFHAHSHQSERVPHRASAHRHSHRRRFPLKALVVGLVHGAAGSAGLLALAMVSVPSPWLACFYVLLFGLGSIAGMASLSLIVSWPIGLAERFTNGFSRVIAVVVGLLGIGLGVHALAANLPAAWGMA